MPRVYDDDTGKNGVFSLTLIGNNGTFEITPNVAERRASFLIRVRDNQYLDYEKRHSVEFQVTPSIDVHECIELTYTVAFLLKILAQELGPATNLSAMVNVTIYVNDVNDNLPVFEQEVYVAEVPENMTAGTKIVQVSRVGKCLWFPFDHLLDLLTSDTEICALKTSSQPILNYSPGKSQRRGHRTWRQSQIHPNFGISEHIIEFGSPNWANCCVDRQSWLRQRTDARISSIC